MAPLPSVQAPAICVLAADPGVPFDTWVRAATETLGAQAEGPARHRIVWLDTFDWRLWRKGIVMEWVGTGRGARLRLRSPGGCRVDFEVPAAAPPRFPADVAQAGLRARIERIAAPRALLPMAEAAGRLVRLSVLDGERKTVLRLELRDERVADRGRGQMQRLIQLLPLRGYERALREAVHRLREAFQVQNAAMDPLALVLSAQGRTPADYSSKPDVPLHPEERTDQALKRILLRLLEVVERNEAGVLKDLDPEFLHDYRVAWRRTRSLLSQVKGVFPGEALDRFGEELRWLSAMTSPVRDLDVYLLEFDCYRASIDPGLSPGLDSLHALIVEDKRTAHAALVKALEGRRYERFKTEWRGFLRSGPEAYTTLKNAARPVLEVASRRIWKVYRRVVEEGRAIGEPGPPEELHELRKTCKKLRYLMEAFARLYPKEAIATSIRDLKRLQDHLGEFQDLAVHRAALEDFRSRLHSRGTPTARTDQAIQALVASFDERAQRVRAAFTERFAAFDSTPVRKRFRALFKDGSRA